MAVMRTQPTTGPTGEKNDNTALPDQAFNKSTGLTIWKWFLLTHRLVVQIKEHILYIHSCMHTCTHTHMQ